MSADKSQPFYASWWFDWVFIGLCFIAGWFLWDHISQHWIENAPLSNRFLELARSLASGDGYTLTHGGIHGPYLQTPPFYPALLALVMTLVGAVSGPELSDAFLALNLSLYLLSIVLTFAFLSRRIKKPYCFYITALYALSPLTLSAAQSMTPAMTYLICSLMALVFIDRYFVDRKVAIARWPLVWTCLWVVAALATKNLGLALLGAFVWMALTKLEFKQAATVVAIIALIMSPWLTRNMLYSSNDALTTVEVQGVEDPESRRAMLSPLRSSLGFGRQLWQNADALSADITDATLGTVRFEYVAGPLLRETGFSDLRFRYAQVSWIRWGVALLALTGLGFSLYQFSGVTGIYAILFILTSLTLPLESSLSVAPVLPLLLFFLYTGLLWLAHGLEKILQTRMAHIAFPVLTALIAINSLDGHLQAFARDSGAATALGMQAVDEDQAVSLSPKNRYSRAIRWLRANTTQDVRLVAQSAEEIERYSGRRARPPINTESTEDLAQELLQRADYIVEDRRSADAGASALSPAIQQISPRLRLAFNDRRADLRIWQVTARP
ncbi:MAG: hypothetical protein IPK79_02720 [Vampirovibrionales bacterium]|nr:hypothetical protein [Vampirovibrionales bacterium]